MGGGIRRNNNPKLVSLVELNRNIFIVMIHSFKMIIIVKAEKVKRNRVAGTRMQVIHRPSEETGINMPSVLRNSKDKTKFKQKLNFFTVQSRISYPCPGYN